jgi:hypothetical protein
MTAIRSEPKATAAWGAVAVARSLSVRPAAHAAAIAWTVKDAVCPRRRRVTSRQTRPR